jgi:hypothetical protein
MPASTERLHGLEPLAWASRPAAPWCAPPSLSSDVTDSATFARPLSAIRRKDVDVAGHQRRLGDDPDRMVERLQHLQDFAHDAPFPLDRLVGVRIGADRDRARLVALLGQLPLQQPRRIRLGKQLRFEVEPRRHSHIGVCRPGEAVDAAVLTPAIGVDGAVEGDVGRVVARDDRARLLDLHLGLERLGSSSSVSQPSSNTWRVWRSKRPVGLTPAPRPPAPLVGRPSIRSASTIALAIALPSGSVSGNVGLTDLFHGGCSS